MRGELTTQEKYAKRGILVLLILVIFAAVAFAQDPALYFNDATSLYYNPAFAGAEQCNKFSLDYKNKWPGDDNSYSTILATYQQPVEKLRGGIGFLVLNDKARNNSVHTSQLGLMYAYEMNIKSKWKLRAGAMVSYANGGADLGYIKNRYEPRAVADQTLPASSVERNYFDFNSGLVFFSQKFMAAASVSHVFTPNECNECAEESGLPRKYTLIAGARLGLNDERSTLFSPAVIFESQGDRYVEQLNSNLPVDGTTTLTGQFELRKGNLITGAGYRFVFDNHPDNILARIGIEVSTFKLSYQFGITPFTEEHPRTGDSDSKLSASHELSFVLNFGCSEEAAGLTCFGN